MQHAGHLEDLHVGKAAHDLVGNIDARLRFADDFVVLRRFFLHRLLGIERDGKVFAADQLAVAHFLAATGNNAIGDSQLVGSELLCGFRHERLARRRCRLAKLHAAHLNREAAPCRALVWRQ